MKRSWIPKVPTPKIGKRLTHELRIPDPEEMRPLAELKISVKVLKPLELMGVTTVAALARVGSRIIAGIPQFSIDLVHRFKDHCANRGIKSKMRAGEIWRMRLSEKQRAYEELGVDPSIPPPKFKSKMPARSKKRSKRKR